TGAPASPRCIGQRQPDRVAGIHLMPPLAPLDPATLDDLTGAERAALATLREADEWAPDTRRSSRPGRRRSATGWSTRRPPSAPESSRSSGRGPTPVATCIGLLPGMSCSTT